MKKKEPSFADWSKEFKKLRKENSTVEEIVAAYTKPVPSNWGRKGWKGTLGYRKRTHDGRVHGEQKIEKDMLGDKGAIRIIELQDKALKHPVVTLYQNFPLANKPDGQVIADVFAVVRVNDVLHPLIVEVKYSHKNPWWALVECLQQVKLARASERLIRRFWEQTINPVPRGTWGLVVAPKSYYSKCRGWKKKCGELLVQLKKKTEARIAFADTRALERKGRLHILLSNW